MAKPYYTSSDIIEAVKRRMAFPISQSTFTETDILAFANEEMQATMVPNIMSFNEEYYVVTKDITLVNNVTRYQIPDRAVGMKLRDIFYKDSTNNLFEMTRIAPDDRSYFDNSTGDRAYAFYLENDFVVLMPREENFTPNGGKLVFVYFQRPNQLVLNDETATINAITDSSDITLTGISDTDDLSIYVNNVEFKPAAANNTAGPIKYFNASGINSADATNLAAVINTALGLTPVVVDNKVTVLSVNTSTTDSSKVTVLQKTTLTTDVQPANFGVDNTYDLLQTKPGHRPKAIDLEPISTSSTTLVINYSDKPSDIEVGDYIAFSGECRIPQLPPEFHVTLVQATTTKILEALGDQAGMSASTAKMTDMMARQATIVNPRVDGAVRKVLNLHSPLRYGGIFRRKRY